MRYSHTKRNDKYGKDQRDTIVTGADPFPGAWIQTWPSAFSSATLPVCSVKVTRIKFYRNSGESGLLPIIHQQMGGQIYLGRPLRVGKPSRAGAKPIISKEADEETIRQAIEADRQSVKAAKAAWEASSGKTASDETFRRFLSALVQDIDV